MLMQQSDYQVELPLEAFVSARLDWKYCPLLLEWWAIWLGVRFNLDVGFHRVTLESDSMQVVQLVKVLHPYQQWRDTLYKI